MVAARAATTGAISGASGLGNALPETSADVQTRETMTIELSRRSKRFGGVSGASWRAAGGLKIFRADDARVCREQGRAREGGGNGGVRKEK